MGTDRPSIVVALSGGLALAFATPPAVFPGAEFLVFVGLAAWFAIATASARPLRHTWLLGCIHIVWFSWSMHHALASFLGVGWMLLTFAAFVVVGGLYSVPGTAMVRRLPSSLRAPGFAIAVAGNYWVRANMPEVSYPHGQPCHVFWQWPALLGSLRLGGEGLANALVAWLAAASVEAWRSWRVGVPEWRVASRGMVAAWAGSILATIVGHALVPPAPVAGRATVSVAAVEIGLHCRDPYLGLSRDASLTKLRTMVTERLLEPTRAALGASPPPDLVLWSESSLPYSADPARIEAGNEMIELPRLDGLLLLGANVERDERDTPSALLVDLRTGRVLAHHEKTCLAPAGEFLPVLRRLPGRWRDAMFSVLGVPPGSVADCVPGTIRPPLRLPDGTPFGALICYDNAFPGPAAAYVDAGARLLCVLSNESWFRGGGELEQMIAMTVCRAIECAVPIVRCTTDGWSAAIDADGRILEELPIQRSPSPAARILRVDLPLGSGALPPMAWLRAALGPIAALALAALLLHGLLRWARLRVARTAPSQRDLPR